MIYPGSLQTHFRSSPFRIFSRIGPVFVRCCHSECARRWYSCVNRSSGKHETGKWIADDETVPHYVDWVSMFSFWKFTSTRLELPSSPCFFQVMSQTLERYGSNVRALPPPGLLQIERKQALSPTRPFSIYFSYTRLIMRSNW